MEFGDCNMAVMFHNNCGFVNAGTALGELPPYFMARAARLSGTHPDDEDYEEFEDLQVKRKHPEEMVCIVR